MNLFRKLSDLGIHSDTVYIIAFGAAVVSILSWFAGGTGRQRNAGERRAIFLALWSPTLMLIGRGLEDAERTKTIVG